jgi:hypothetical protein
VATAAAIPRVRPRIGDGRRGGLPGLGQGGPGLVEPGAEAVELVLDHAPPLEGGGHEALRLGAGLGQELVTLALGQGEQALHLGVDVVEAGGGHGAGGGQEGGPVHAGRRAHALGLGLEPGPLGVDLAEPRLGLFLGLAHQLRRQAPGLRQQALPFLLGLRQPLLGVPLGLGQLGGSLGPHPGGQALALPEGLGDDAGPLDEGIAAQALGVALGCFQVVLEGHRVHHDGRA